MFDFDNDFYRPLWIRIVLVATAIGWGIVEVITGSPGFAVLFLSVGGYIAYRLLLTYSPPKE